MSPEGGFPVEVSSNTGDKDNLKSQDGKVWESNPSDESYTKPTVTITVTDDNQDKFVDDIIITGSTNVASVTVTVYDENDEVIPDVLKP